MTRAKIYYLCAWANNHFLDTCILIYTCTHPNPSMWFLRFPSIHLKCRSHRWYEAPITGSERYPGEKLATHSVILPGKFHRQRTWRAIVHGILKSQTWLSICTYTYTQTQIFYWFCYQSYHIRGSQMPDLTFSTYSTSDFSKELYIFSHFISLFRSIHWEDWSR